MNETLLSEELLARIAEQLKVLADPTRLKLLHRLGKGELCVGDLVDRVGGSQANISKHLGVLKNAGLVRSRRSGMNVCYTLEEPTVFDICRLVRDCLERQAAQAMAEIDRSGTYERDIPADGTLASSGIEPETYYR